MDSEAQLLVTANRSFVFPTHVQPDEIDCLEEVRAQSMGEGDSKSATTECRVGGDVAESGDAILAGVDVDSGDRYQAVGLFDTQVLSRFQHSRIEEVLGVGFRVERQDAYG